MREGDAFRGTLGGLFQHAVDVAGSREFLRTASESCSFSEIAAWSASLAGGLRGRSIGPGDRVVVMAGNRAEVVVTWLACLRVGACFCPLNPESPPPHLANVVRAIDPAAMLCDDEHLEAARITAALAGRSPFVTNWQALEHDSTYELWSEAQPGSWAAVMSTSGTTGPSKAIALSHRWFTKICETSAANWGFGPDDRFYCPLPLYHMDGLALTVAPAIYHATTAAIGGRFSVSRFWSEMREFEATVFDFLGSTLTLLWKQPTRADDSDNPARLGWGVPLPAFKDAFESRFGCALVDCYGSTDVGIPVYSTPEVASPPGSCGRVVDGYDVAILNPEGVRVAAGIVGEIAVRPLEPHVILEEYVGTPEATVDAWRGLWHHTGDEGRIDADGYVYFEGRITDSIRRRGENISAFELETLVLAHEQVVDVAAIGVPSELTEDDVKLVVVVRDRAAFSPAELQAWCETALPRFMTVRHIEIVDDLPRTQTGKVAKRALRENWRTESTWDAQAGRYSGGCS